ncbi:serine protease hepsin-like [Condylostylus longicornis]|uniref:serine protease hepsin-like n=1 Tax=Condylostylus longicornis TaxID=2530218 RepID=UPI00244DD50D|nr:serine protease hepsin-like [Condylostylus longicornis]
MYSLLILSSLLIFANVANTEDRIVGGSFQSIATAAYQALVLPRGFLCGGSILNPSWIVTAAHCTDGFDETSVQVAVGIQDRSLLSYNQLLSISVLIQNPLYDSSTYDGDISLLKLSFGLLFTPTVKPIALAASIPPPGTVVSVSGYGKTELGTTSSVLLSVSLQISDWNYCNRFYGTLTQNQFCAVALPNQKADSCQGDSGGPIVYNGQLLGIVSAGAGCVHCSAESEDRIVGGAALDIVARNFQVAVIPNGQICGGSLIAYDWVLTAAHCTVNVVVEQIVVRAGSIYFYKGGQTSWVSQIINHPKYVNSRGGFDISLLRLYPGFQPSVSIGLVSLATSLPPPDTEVTVSGYGTLNFHGIVAPILQYVTVSVVDFEYCNQCYDNQLTSSMFCAAGEGKDACQGDSGGPITYGVELIGVVSFGEGCANATHPGIYTSIPFNLAWINRQLVSDPPETIWVQNYFSR